MLKIDYLPCQSSSKANNIGKKLHSISLCYWRLAVHVQECSEQSFKPSQNIVLNSSIVNNEIVASQEKIIFWENSKSASVLVWVSLRVSFLLFFFFFLFYMKPVLNTWVKMRNLIRNPCIPLNQGSCHVSPFISHMFLWQQLFLMLR